MGQAPRWWERTAIIYMGWTQISPVSQSVEKTTTNIHCVPSNMHNTDMRNSVPGTFYHYLKITVFWYVTPCNFVRMDRRFGEEYLLPPSYNQIPLAKVKWQWVPLNRQCVSTRQRGVTSHLERQCTYKHNTEARSRNHRCHRKAISIKYCSWNSNFS